LELTTYAIAWQANIYTVFQFETPADFDETVGRALEISQQHGFIYSEGLLKLGVFYRLAGQGRVAEALPYLQQGVEMAAQVNNPRTNANLLQIQAWLAALQGDAAAAEALLLQSIDEFLVINDLRNVLHSRSNLAHLYRRGGNIQAALPLYRETIRRWQEEGSLPAVAHQLECFAYLALGQGEPEPAARLLGRAKAVREELNSPSTDPAEVGEQQQAMAHLAEALGEAERDRNMAEGARMSVDEAVALALALSDSSSGVAATTR
jgi:tetratricopeptide (TPR) repeat protein